MHRFDRTRSVAAAVLAVQFLFAGGCGYRNQLSASTTVGTTPDGRGTARIAVLAIRNDSPEPWLDRIVTDAMRREIDSRGDFDFVDDPYGADMVIRGRIRPLHVVSKSFSRFVAALEYSLTLQLDLEVVRAGGDIVRLDPSVLVETDVYFASPDVEVTRTNRLEVLRRISDLLASRVADSLEMLKSPIPDSEMEGEG
jgi:hypothetical protein